MKRNLILISSLLLFAVGTFASDFETAKDAVKNMGVGWNLGNTLDANAGTGKLPSDAGFWGQQGLESETCWGQPYATAELIKMMKEAGFGAIRVPVTWYNHMDKDGKVSAEWMKRVHEVVDYVINEGLYCILNVHHDTGADGNNFHSWVKASGNFYNTYKATYEGLWKQIAAEFKDYDQHLLFEAYNEMLDEDNCWNYPYCYYDGRAYNEEVATDSYAAINNYAKSFLNIVRSSGGNNTQRNLVISTYAASWGTPWGNNMHPTEPMKNIAVPDDTTEGHLTFEVHTYPDLCNSNKTNKSFNDVKNGLDTQFKSLKTYLADKGLPIIVGEWGSNQNIYNGQVDYNDRKDLLLEFADYFVKKCKTEGIACFYWMGLTDGPSRSMPAFNQPELAQAIVKAYHGSSDAYTYPTSDNFETTYIVKYLQNWSELFLYGDWNNSAILNLSDYKGIRVEMDGDYSDKLQVKVYGDKDGKNADGSDKFKEQYTPLAAGTTTTVTFDAATLGSTVCRITLQTNVGPTTGRIKSAKLIKSDDSEVPTTITVAWGCEVSSESSPVSGIQAIQHDATPDDRIYNLAGQRITKPSKGIYIKNKKKYIVR